MSKQISLTRGYVATVDDADYEWLSQWKWCFSHGYAYRKGKLDKTVYMHRLVMGAVRGQEVDHINGDKLDNCRSNLRYVSRSQNLQNKGLIRSNTSGVTGVHWCNTSLRWVASIKLNGKRKTLGYFKDKTKAVEARKRGERIYFGEFARQT